MRVLLIILALVSLGLMACSGEAASPLPTIDASALAAEVCGQLTGTSPSSGREVLISGMKVAIRRSLPVEDYSKALAGQCPARMRRTIGTESFADWLKD